MKRHKLAFSFAFSLSLAGYSPVARSQETVPSPSAAATLTESEVQKILGSYAQPAAETKGQDAAVAVQPPSILLPTPQMKWDKGFWTATPRKEFTLHVGMWLQFDNVKR